MLIPVGILASAGLGFGAGYFFFQAVTQKLSFQTDTFSSGPALQAETFDSTGVANAKVAGYIAGGRGFIPDVGTVVYSRIERFSFPSDSRSTLTTSLSQTTDIAASGANAEVAGYFVGGANTTTQPATYLRTANKLLFSNESRTVLASQLDATRYRMGAVSNSGTAAYFGGGVVDNAFVDNKINKLTFASDSFSVISATTSLGIESSNMASLSNSGVAGYYAGGGQSTEQRVLDKINFSNDTRSTNSTWLAIGRRNSGSASNTGVAGYMVSGLENFNNVSTSQKLNFSNDSRSALSSSVTPRTYAESCFSNDVNL